jgi:hypothetical protein
MEEKQQQREERIAGWRRSSDKCRERAEFML